LVVLFEDLKMHGTTNHKFINAKQARDIYAYKNLKQKLHKTIAAIWFNNTGTGGCGCSSKVLLMMGKMLPETC
jgi:hypothetical protein